MRLHTPMDVFADIVSLWQTFLHSLFAFRICLVVCLQDLIASTNERDASGNPKLADIGMHLKTILKQYFDRADVKYIDPTYMIRAIATTSPDRVYCKVLSHNAVHAAFGGFTGALPSCLSCCF